MALPERIPLEVLFGNPTYAGPELSPDGERIAYVAPDEGFLNRLKFYEAVDAFLEKHLA